MYLHSPLFTYIDVFTVRFFLGLLNPFHQVNVPLLWYISPEIICFYEVYAGDGLTKIYARTLNFLKTNKNPLCLYNTQHIVFIGINAHGRLNFTTRFLYHKHTWELIWVGPYKYSTIFINSNNNNNNK